MAFCGKCGAQVPDGVQFCGECGAPVEAAGAPQQQYTAPQQPQYQQPQYQQAQYQQPQYQQAPVQQAVEAPAHINGVTDYTSYIDPNDIQQNKVWGGLPYFGILFFLPLVCAPQSRYGRFHANQGLILLITSVVLEIIAAILGAIFTAISWRLYFIGTILTSIISIGVTVFCILGLINGFTGKAKELPVIGQLRLIK